VSSYSYASFLLLLLPLASRVEAPGWLIGVRRGCTFFGLLLCSLFNTLCFSSPLSIDR
jgi:hypothetical protein